MSKSGCVAVILSFIVIVAGLWYLTTLRPDPLPAGRKAQNSPIAQSTLTNSPSPSASPIAIANDQDALDLADKIKAGQTATAYATETLVKAEETSKSWSLTQWQQKLNSDKETRQAKETLVSWDITLTPLARIQKQEEDLDAKRQVMEPIWDWSGIIVFWVLVILIYRAVVYLIPALAERLRPAPVYYEQTESNDTPQFVERSFRMHIVEDSPGGFRGYNFSMPCSIDQFNQLCQGMVQSNGKDLAETTWMRSKKGEDKPFSQREFRQVRDVLLKNEIIMLIDPRDSSKGFVATPKGMMAFNRWVNGEYDDITFSTTPPPR